jgi:hypothetical protein
MTPAGMTGRTRANTALAGQAAHRNRWPAGTLAAAGTIPARTMNAYATLVFSQGTILRITDLRSRHAYMRVAVKRPRRRPGRHPHPPGPPPEPRPPGAPVPWPPIIGSRQLSRTRDHTGTPTFPASRTAQPRQTIKTRHRNCKALTYRFI